MRTHKLSSPVEYKGKTYEELTLSPVKAKHLRIAHQEENPVDNQINLIAALADVSPALIDELPAADFRTLSDAIGREIAGKKSAPRNR